MKFCIEFNSEVKNTPSWTWNFISSDYKYMTKMAENVAKLAKSSCKKNI